MRKVSAGLMRLPRMARRLGDLVGSRNGPHAVIANSFPKSGTHLLEQVVVAFPDVRNFGVFLASMTSSWRFRERTRASTLRVIRGIVPGELVRGHLFYDRAYEAAIRDVNAVHYFIYRDPRDVVISEAHYLREMNRWHRLHRVVRRLDPESAITVAIRGIDSGTGLDYPDIGQRFARFAGWLESAETFALRFEDLRSERCGEIVTRMLEFFDARHPGRAATDGTVRRALDGIDPRKSHTFREGRPSAWRREFTEEHKGLFKDVAGRLLVDLGYENDLQW